MSRAITAIVVLAGLLLFACSGREDEASPTSTPSSVTPSATQAVPTVGPTEPFTPAPSGAATFRVLAGATDGAFDIEQFMPAVVRIRAGDTITWTSQGFEGHTVTFFPDGKLGIGPDGYLVEAADTPGTREFNPIFALGSDAQGSYSGTEYVNSGFFGVPAPGDYSLTFPEVGSYSYLCMVHPFHMRGEIVVEPAGTDVPAPAAVEAEGLSEKAQFADEMLAAVRADQARRQAQHLALGGHTWPVSVGLDTPHAQALVFTPGAIEVASGDKVTFWNSERDFHNIIFAPEGTDPPQFPILKTVEGKLGFRLLINPESEHEIPPPPDFGPETLFSSGIIGITFPRVHYEVTFTKPGTYNYYCTIHTLAGMAGSITVR